MRGFDPASRQALRSVNLRRRRSMLRRVVTYEDLAARIAAVLGVDRPAVSTLRAAAAARGRSSSARTTRSRLTAGMPAPARFHGRAYFDPEEVEDWLQGHPWLLARQARAELVDAAARAARLGGATGKAELRTAVGRARNAGLSWRAITAALADSGTARSVQAVHKRFRADAILAPVLTSA